MDGLTVGPIAGRRFAFGKLTGFDGELLLNLFTVNDPLTFDVPSTSV